MNVPATGKAGISAVHPHAFSAYRVVAIPQATMNAKAAFGMSPSYQIRMTMKYTELAKGLRHG